MKKTISGIGMIFLLVAASADATFINVQPNTFAVLAGGKLETSTGTHINGWVGAVNYIKLGNANQIIGDAYTNSHLRTGKNTLIQGRVVTADNLKLGNVSETGSLDSGSKVYVRRSSTVHGDVNYTKTFTIHPSSVVEGTVTANDLPDSWLPIMQPIVGFAEVVGENLIFEKGSTETLAPGNYNKLKAKSQSTLYLTAGLINYSCFSIGSGSHVTGSIYSSGNVLIGRNVTIDQDPIPAEIPEPASILFLLGSPIIFFRRYRRYRQKVIVLQNNVKT